jgi:hypothetical protein
LQAKGFDPDAATQLFWLYRAASCPVGESYCQLDSLVDPTVFVSFNRDDEDCLTIDESTINTNSLDELIKPTFPCVVSPKASLPIQLTPELSPLTFFEGQFAARYEPSDQDPIELRDGVLFGFIPKTQAEKLVYNYNGMDINLWSVIRGSDHPQACAPRCRAPRRRRLPRPRPQRHAPGRAGRVRVSELHGHEDRLLRAAASVAPGVSRGSG